MANIAVTSDSWETLPITSGTVQNISATADIELSSEQTDNSGIVLAPGEMYGWDSKTIYARAVTEDNGTIRVVNFKKSAGGGGSYVLPIASENELGGVKIGNNLDIDASGVLSAVENYSTTEQVIGTWIDGKPLYQITIQDTMPTVTTDGTRATKIVDIDSLHIKYCVESNGFVFRSGLTGINMMMLNSISDMSVFRFVQVYRANAEKDYVDSLMLLSSDTGDSEKPCYITLKYTKTTD